MTFADYLSVALFGGAICGWCYFVAWALEALAEWGERRKRKARKSFVLDRMNKWVEPPDAA